EVVDVFFHGDPAHVRDHHVLGRPTERAADSATSDPPGPKQRAFNSSFPQNQALKSQTFELADRGDRWDVRFACPVVEPAEIAPNQASRPADSVMAAVLVKIGMKARDDRQPAPQGESERAQTECRLGGDVDDLGPKRINGTMNRSERREREIQLFVKW